MMARVSREIPAGRRPSQFNPPGAGVPTWEKGAGRLPLSGAKRMKPMLMVARRTEAGWFASGGGSGLKRVDSARYAHGRAEHRLHACRDLRRAEGEGPARRAWRTSPDPRL